MKIVQNKTVAVIESVDEAVTPTEIRASNLGENEVIKVSTLFKNKATEVYGFMNDGYPGYVVFQGSEIIGSFGSSEIIRKIQDIFINNNA